MKQDCVMSIQTRWYQRTWKIQKWATEQLNSTRYNGRRCKHLFVRIYI